MKKLFLSTILLITLSLAFTSCRDTKKTDSIEVEAKKAGEAAEGALEQTGKAIDDAVKETKEAGEATKEAIEKIGDN